MPIDTDSADIDGIKDLLREQSLAAHKVVVASQAIKERLAAQGIQIDVPRSPGPAQESSNFFGKLLPTSRRSNPTAGTLPLLDILSHKMGMGPKQRQKNLIPDAETLKANLLKPSYNVEDLYHTTGMFQAWARGDLFQNVALVVIAFNAIWIGIATDINKAEVLLDAPVWIQVVENLFCLFFTMELTVRLLAFKRKGDAFTDGWFVFDFLLVALMVFETWGELVLVAAVGKDAVSQNVGGGAGNAMVLRILRICRIARLTRVARIARLLRSCPELLILSKAMIYAMRSVSATLVLLSISIYIFSIFFVQMLSESPAGQGKFETVPMGMHTLLVDGILADQADIINALLDQHVMYYFAILLYLLVAALTVANMLIGVICDTIGNIADEEKENMMKEKVNEAIAKIAFKFDTDGSNTLNKAEFGKLLSNESATQLLHEVGVDVVALSECADMIFEDDNVELSFEDFMDVVFGFRDSDSFMKTQMTMKKAMKQELMAMEMRLRGK